MIYSLGLDTAKEDFHACLHLYNLQNQSHDVIANKQFSNTLSGFKACMSWVSRHTKAGPAPIRVTMEATGVYYEPLALHIREQYPDIHLSVVLPSQARDYIKSRGLRSKTDKIDAHGLALMGGERNLAPWKGIDPFWRRLRAMTRTRSGLMDQRTQLRNQLHAIEHSGVDEPTVDASLQECIRAINQQIDALTRQIAKHLRLRKDLSNPIACLRSIPGVGTITIAAVLAETNGFEEFHAIGQLISFSGYDVLIKESGKWAGQPQISKQGSKYIRQAMYMPASTAIRCQAAPIIDFYNRLLGKHGVKMKAHVAVQKKLLSYMYFLWKKAETFDPEKIRTQQRLHQKNVAPSSADGEATVDASLVLTQ